MKLKERFTVPGWWLLPLSLLLASCAAVPDKTASPTPEASPADTATASLPPGPEAPRDGPGERPQRQEDAEEPPDEEANLPDVPLLAPGEHMGRARELIEQAQEVRQKRSTIPEVGGVFARFGDALLYRRIYGEAQAHLLSVLRNHPDSGEAPEALYLLGVTYDHPHLTDFTRAVKAYRETEKRYPQTKAAEKAGARLAVLEEIIGSGPGSP